MPSKLKTFLSAWIYLGWFGCVYFAKTDWSFVSLIFPLISWILMCLVFGLDRHLLVRILVLFFIGIFFDCAAEYLKLIQLNDLASVRWLPVWLISIWLLFISSLPLLQSLFKKKYFLASLLGAVFGPLSYRAGSQFGLLEMNGTRALIIYSIFWAIYIPSAIYWLGQRSKSNESH